MEMEETLPVDLRCKKTDGRDWRCKRPAVAGKSYCDNHIYRGGQKRNPSTKSRKLETLEEDSVPSPESDPVPMPEDDDVRCHRNDGGRRRCKRRAIEGKTLCEIHSKKLKTRKSPERDESLIIPENLRCRRKKKRDSSPVPENLRCTRTYNNNWRCKRLVKEGETLCEFHSQKTPKKPPPARIQVDFSPEEEDLRCKRTDGRGWWCKRKVLEGKSLCEIHYEQGRLRNMRVTVPESLKIKRGGNGEKLQKILKRNSDKGVKKMKKKVRGVFLKREITERSKKGEKDGENPREVTKNLPYGLMEIPPVPPTQFFENNGSVGIKVGVHCSNSSVNRRFRSKNIEPPVPPTEFLENNGSLGIKVGVHCSNSLINRRFRSKNIEPPVPPTQFLENTGSLGIKVGVNCSDSPINRRFRSKNIEPPPISSLKVVRNNGKRKCHWCRMSGKPSLTKCSSCRKQFFCSDCIKERYMDAQEVKLRCPVCCGSCDCKACWTTRSKDVGTKEILKEQCKGSKFHHLLYLINYLLPILERINHEQSLEVEMEAKLKGMNLYEVEIRQADVGCSDRCCCNNCKNAILDFHRSCPNCSYNLCLSCCREFSQVGSLGVTKKHFPGIKGCSEKIFCPPMELGGCDNSLLDLRCIFPLNWTKELEISAKEIASEHDSLQTSNDSVEEAGKSKELQEASRRKESDDNFLYFPSTSNDNDSMFAHFRKHWQKGHPVKVRNVLQGASNLIWDPLTMLCTYLEKRSKNGVDFENCSDRYEVEFGIKESFVGSLKEGNTRIQRETLKVKAKLSSLLSRKLFESHYDEVIHALPLQEYTNPRSGLMNLAGKLPEDFSGTELIPHVFISCGSRDELKRGELLTKLCYNSYDVVNILVHTNNAPCSKEQLNKIKKLITQIKAKNKGDFASQNTQNKETRMHNSGISVAGVNGVNKSPVKVQVSDTDSDVSMICSGTTSHSPQKSVDQMPESSNLSDKISPLEPCGTQWDVFRRQDVPKLLEYITMHVDELSHCYGLPKNVVHPILDGSFHLNATHKMRLKDEFEIEPWTFNQCLGEAVFIPTGCPYQIRYIKSCTNVALGFISPENASECIKLMNEIRVLPNNHKAKQEKLEVEKMTLCSIDEAIKEIYRLRSEKGSHLHT